MSVWKVASSDSFRSLQFERRLTLQTGIARRLLLKMKFGIGNCYEEMQGARELPGTQVWSIVMRHAKLEHSPKINVFSGFWFDIFTPFCLFLDLSFSYRSVFRTTGLRVWKVLTGDGSLHRLTKQAQDALCFSLTGVSVLP